MPSRSGPRAVAGTGTGTATPATPRTCPSRSGPAASRRGPNSAALASPRPSWPADCRAHAQARSCRPLRRKPDARPATGRRCAW
ncbi:hypothetical protein G6F24_018446 [Rhizopus arrhizus]|nr:hypothetical protein G6F24_018446 [Rhizopus arrhizus]